MDGGGGGGTYGPGGSISVCSKAAVSSVSLIVQTDFARTEPEFII